MESATTDVSNDVADRVIDRAALIERVVKEVIDTALAARPRRGMRHWYRLVAAKLAGSGAASPSRHAFERRFTAERRRRRDLLLAASQNAADAITRAVGEGGIELFPDQPPVTARACGLVVRALAEWRSSRVGEANGDYAQLSYRAGERSMSPEAFRALVYSSFFVENVPHELMPDWWRRKVA